jgi:hypothetical protein
MSDLTGTTGLRDAMQAAIDDLCDCGSVSGCHDTKTRKALIALLTEHPADADLEAAKAEAWDEAAEAVADWMSNNPSPSGIPHDPPRNPYDGEAQR